MTQTYRRYVAIGCCAALLALFAATARLAWWNKSLTFDEPLHLVSALAQTHDADYYVDSENSALWKYYAVAGIKKDALPLNFATPRIPYGTYSYEVLYEQAKVNVLGLTNSARTRMTLLGVILGAIIAWWAWRLAGAVAAVVATAAFCLDPNFLAHTPLIKNDVAITLMFVGLMAIVWLLGERVTIWRGIAAGLLLGAAVTTKFSGILGIPVLMIALCSRALLPQPWTALKWIAQSRWHRLTVAAGVSVGSLVVAWIVVWAVYGFHFAPPSESRSKTDFHSLMNDCAVAESLAAHHAPNETRPEVLDSWVRRWKPSLIPRTAVWLNEYFLLPQPWIEGFLIIHSTGQTRSSFLLGEIRWQGWWYYFPLVMAFKTPLAILAAVVLAAATPIWWQRRDGSFGKKKMLAIALSAALAIAIPLALRPLFHPGLREYLPIYSCVILAMMFVALTGSVIWAAISRKIDFWPLIAAGTCPVLYLAFAMQSHLDIGIRHILPVYPFLFILIGIAAARSINLWPRASIAIVGVFVLALAVESYAAYPNYIPFFNAAVGGPRGGLNLLGDSNIDWGQELPDLAKWQARNPDCTLYLGYFGFADPKTYGVHAVILPGRVEDRRANPTTQHGRLVYAISAALLRDGAVEPSRSQFFVRFREMKPFAVLGDSLYLFDAPPRIRSTQKSSP